MAMASVMEWNRGNGRVPKVNETIRRNKIWTGLHEIPGAYVGSVLRKSYCVQASQR